VRLGFSGIGSSQWLAFLLPPDAHGVTNSEPLTGLVLIKIEY